MRRRRVHQHHRVHDDVRDGLAAAGVVRERRRRHPRRPAAFASLSLTHLYGDRAGTHRRTRGRRVLALRLKFLDVFVKRVAPAAATSLDWIVRQLVPRGPSSSPRRSRRSSWPTSSIDRVRVFRVAPDVLRARPTLRAKRSKNRQAFADADDVKLVDQIFETVQSSSVTLAWHSGAWGWTPTLPRVFPSMETASSAD